jgi:broad specificity phosphatase PhoE
MQGETMLRLLLTRHGESRWQVLGDEAGSDSPLTDLGRRQADSLGRWLAGHIAVDHIYASPLRRAWETAQRVASHLDLPVHRNDGLKEAPFFVVPELPAYSTPASILEGEQPDPVLGTEAYRAFRSQVAQALREILDLHSEGTILIVAHGGTLGTALRLLLGSDAFSVNVGNTTLHSLTWSGARWHIEYVDRWEHLVALRRPAT